MRNAIKNTMLNHYIKILYNGFINGDLGPIYQFLSNDFTFCDWSRRHIYEQKEKIVPLEYLAKTLKNTKYPFSLKAVKLGVEGIRDRGYLTPFDNIALLLCHVTEDKQYYETLFCIRLSKEYEIECVIAIKDAKCFIDSDYIIE